MAALSSPPPVRRGAGQPLGLNAMNIFTQEVNGKEVLAAVINYVGEGVLRKNDSFYSLFEQTGRVLNPEGRGSRGTTFVLPRDYTAEEYDDFLDSINFLLSH